MVPRQVTVGEILRIPALGADAEVVREVGAEAELSVQGKKVRLPLSQLQQYAPRRFAEKIV